MSVIAEFRLWNPDLPLMESLATVPGMELEVEHEFAKEPTEPVIFAWATGDDFAAFEARVAEDRTVKSLRVVDDHEDHRLYRIQVSERANVVMYPAGLEVGASQLAVTATHRGLDVRQRYVDRESFARYRELVREQGVEFTVRRVYSAENSAPVDEYGLSEKQRSTLRRAVSGGYFAVPRAMTLRDLADSLGISRQAASERLRRGLAHLVRNTVGTEETEAV